MKVVNGLDKNDQLLGVMKLLQENARVPWVIIVCIICILII